MTILGQKIIDFLEKETGEDLSNEEGVLAGQSVAEAYFRINGIDVFSKVKDLDIFCYAKGNKLFGNNSKKIKLYKRSSFVEKDKENSFCMSHKKAIEVGYSIIESKQNGLKNYVLIESYISKSEFLKTIVNSFDMNIVKIGVDLKTKKVLISDDFKNFLKTKKMELVYNKSKASSIVRFLKKSEEIKGVTFDKELAIFRTIIHYGIDEFRYNNGKKIFINSGVYIDKFLSLSTENQNLLHKFFNIEEYHYKRISQDIVKFTPKKHLRYTYSKLSNLIFKNKGFLVFLTQNNNIFNTISRNINDSSIYDRVRILIKMYKKRKALSLRDIITFEKDFIKTPLDKLEEYLVYASKDHVVYNIVRENGVTLDGFVKRYKYYEMLFGDNQRYSCFTNYYKIERKSFLRLLFIKEVLNIFIDFEKDDETLNKRIEEANNEILKRIVFKCNKLNKMSASEKYKTRRITKEVLAEFNKTPEDIKNEFGIEIFF